MGGASLSRINRKPRNTLISANRSSKLISRAKTSQKPSQAYQSVSESQGRKHAPDYMIVVIVSLLIVTGAIIGYTNSPGLTEIRGLPSDFYTKKQLIATGIGLIAFFVAAVVDLDFWRKVIKPAVISAAIVAVAVRLFGTPIYGAYRWLDIGGISVQAAEVIKFSLVLWLSYFVYQHKKIGDLFESQQLKILAAVTGIIVIVVAGLQSDLGSAAVMLAMIFGVLFIAGLPSKYILYSGIAFVVVGALAILPSAYRVQRVETFLNPQADCQDTGYQVCQALISVGSGGVTGKGLGRSVQAYGYLPEALSDSIFAIISENLGFLGAAFVVLLFLELYRRLHKIAVASPNSHHRYMVFAIVMWLATQTAINIGAMIGLLPLKGITLPLISFGGTSIIFVLAALGICFRISRYTDLRAARLGESRGTSRSDSKPTDVNNAQRVYRRR